jgi:hypothetical protein
MLALPSSALSYFCPVEKNLLYGHRFSCRLDFRFSNDKFLHINLPSPVDNAPLEFQGQCVQYPRYIAVSKKVSFHFSRLEPIEPQFRIVRKEKNAVHNQGHYTAKYSLALWHD